MPQLSHNEILFWILCLIALEVAHLKWIWWQFWSCSRCGARNHHCACGRARRIMTLL
jgi:hypothetical protein